MEQSEELIKILRSVGAIITDSHIVGTSGKHMSVYINKDALYPHTEMSSKVGLMFAEKFKDLDIDTVVAPALGGIILSQWTAYHLSKLKNKEIFGVYTEKTLDNEQIFKRGYDKLITGKNILVLEDITNTGGSIKKVINSVKNAGGNILASCVMVNRDPENVNSSMMGVLFDSLAVIKAESYDEADCPLCKANIPINTQVGHGKEFLKNKK